MAFKFKTSKTVNKVLAGAGIVADSKPINEFNVQINKLMYALFDI